MLTGVWEQLNIIIRTRENNTPLLVPFLSHTPSETPIPFIHLRFNLKCLHNNVTEEPPIYIYIYAWL